MMAVVGKWAELSGRNWGEKAGRGMAVLGFDTLVFVLAYSRRSV